MATTSTSESNNNEDNENEDDSEWQCWSRLQLKLRPGDLYISITVTSASSSPAAVVEHNSQGHGFGSLSFVRIEKFKYFSIVDGTGNPAFPPLHGLPLNHENLEFAERARAADLPSALGHRHLRLLIRGLPLEYDDEKGVLWFWCGLEMRGLLMAGGKEEGTGLWVYPFQRRMTPKGDTSLRHATTEDDRGSILHFRNNKIFMKPWKENPLRSPSNIETIKVDVVRSTTLFLNDYVQSFPSWHRGLLILSPSWDFSLPRLRYWSQISWDRTGGWKRAVSASSSTSVHSLLVDDGDEGEEGNLWAQALMLCWECAEHTQVGLGIWKGGKALSLYVFLILGLIWFCICIQASCSFDFYPSPLVCNNAIWTSKPEAGTAPTQINAVAYVYYYRLC